LQALDKKRIEAPELVITRKSNPPAVVIADEAQIPEGFWIQPPAPPKRIDKGAVGKALKAGQEVAGAYLEAGERLDIKP
jgi:hypothetical protein